jgi:hypothetical protein
MSKGTIPEEVRHPVPYEVADVVLYTCFEYPCTHSAEAKKFINFVRK